METEAGSRSQIGEAGRGNDCGCGVKMKEGRDKRIRYSEQGHRREPTNGRVDKHVGMANRMKRQCSATSACADEQIRIL